MDATHSAPTSRAERIAGMMADHTTPLIRNAWYVAGWSTDFTRQLASRVILDRKVVLFRRSDGRPVVMQDRCPHRSMPLSKGYLEGDNIRCGYHGLVFDCSGACTEVPQQEGTPPANLRIESYKVVERRPLVWVWMGDQSVADESTIPDTSWLRDPGWDYAYGYVHLKANYVGLHENLLDLSHFTYLHPGNIGTPEYAATPFTAQISDNHVLMRRFVPDCPVPSIYSSPTGMSPDTRISRDSMSEYVSPGMCTADAILKRLKPEPGKQTDFIVKISHFITPESQHTTHYFFTFARNFALGDKMITEFMARASKKAFLEDADALEAINDVTQLESSRRFSEFNIKSDQGGVAMRRILKRLADAERPAPAMAAE